MNARAEYLLQQLTELCKIGAHTSTIPPRTLAEQREFVRGVESLAKSKHAAAEVIGGAERLRLAIVDNKLGKPLIRDVDNVRRWLQATL